MGTTGMQTVYGGRCHGDDVDGETSDGLGMTGGITGMTSLGATTTSNLMKNGVEVERAAWGDNSGKVESRARGARKRAAAPAEHFRRHPDEAEFSEWSEEAGEEYERLATVRIFNLLHGPVLLLAANHHLATEARGPISASAASWIGLDLGDEQDVGEGCAGAERSTR